MRYQRLVLDLMLNDKNECIQMVIGYLDIFVFEELGFTVRPVAEGKSLTKCI